MELDKYKWDVEGKTALTNDECIEIAKDLGDTEYNILELIKHEGQSSTKLSIALDKSIRTIKEHYKPLQKHKIIESKAGIGICLSIKGIKFIRWAMSKPSAIVQKNNTNEDNGEEKLHQCTNGIHPLREVIGEKTHQKQLDITDAEIKQLKDQEWNVKDAK